MKFMVVLVAAGAAAFLGALICILASVYPPRGRGAPPGAVANGNSINGTLGSESPLDALGAPGAVAHAGPLGALQGGGSYDGGNGLGVGPEVPAPGPGDVVVPGAGDKRVGFSRLICTPVPVGGCGRPQADDPWSAAAADADADSAFLRTTADELRRMVAQQDHQILMDQRTIRELTGKLSECESGLEDQDVPERSVGAGGGAWSSSRRFMAGDDVSSSSPSASSSSAAATAAQLQTARAVEELERAIMDLKDRIEKLEAEIGPAAFNLTDASAGASSSSGGGGASGPVSAGGSSSSSSSSSSSKTSSSPPASPGASVPGAPGSGGRRPAARPPAARPPAQQGGGAGGRGGKGTWKVGDLEGELERKIKLLEKERQTMRKESQGHRDNIDKGLDAVDHRLAELEHTMTDLSFPDGFVVYFPIRTNYMYGLVRREMPEMYAFTACLWLKTKEGGIGTPFSYSVPGQPNELVLLQGVHNPVELLINDKVAQLPLSLLQDEWQHVCVSWTLRDGVWKAYQGGKMKGRGEGLAAWHPIKPGGVLILGQEQDTLGGRFDASQALVGELSQFNLWDRVLKPAEVASLADCSSSLLGNVAPWTDLDVDVYEGATKESLDPCHAAQRTNPKGHKQ